MTDSYGMAVKNASGNTATCPFTSTQGPNEVTGMHGQNNGGYELRVTQETGTH